MVYKNFYPKINFKDKSISNVKTSVKNLPPIIHIYSTPKRTRRGKNNLGKNKKEFYSFKFKKFNNIMLHYLNKKDFQKTFYNGNLLRL